MQRRLFLTAAAALAATPMTARAHHINPVVHEEISTPPADVVAMYGRRVTERFPLPAINAGRIAEQFWRARVPYETDAAPGSLVVDTSSFHLYFVEPEGWAMRYGVSLGRAGFEWSGAGVIEHLRAWPRWTPTRNMIRRDPALARWRRGMPPGLRNPLGARALYIFQNGQDTLYRVHGTPQPYSIGTAASSGCVRMINQDVVDLYQRVQPGAALIVT